MDLTGRNAIPLSRVPPEYRTVDTTVAPPASNPAYELDDLLRLQTALSEQYQFDQCFSGVDYTITAVVPYEHRFSGPSPEVQSILSSLAALQLSESGTMTPEERKRLAGDRQTLQEALRRAQSGAGAEKPKPFYKTFGELQTLSITSRRSAEPVRRCGEASPAAYTKGPRTFAGTMVFTLLKEDVLIDLYRVAEGDRYDGEPFFVQDRLPPFNILIQGSNEGGHIVEAALFGVELIASGITLSIDDLFTEQQYTYVARWMLPFSKRSRTNSVLHDLGRAMVPPGLGAMSELEPATRSTTRYAGRYAATQNSGGNPFGFSIGGRSGGGA